MSRLTSIRLSALTDSQIVNLAVRFDTTKSDIIGIAVDRMYQQENRQMKTINVKIDVTEYGMFSGDWSGVDMNASANRYIKLLQAKIERQFVNARVNVEGIDEPTMKSVEIDGFAYSERDDTLGAIENIINRCYQDFDAWVVNT